MDVLRLLDRLEGLFEAAKRVPLVDQVRVDRPELTVLLDELRMCVGAELKEARWLVQHRQEVRAEVARECDRILIDAREQAALELKQTGLLAERQAGEILVGARKRAFEIGYDVEQWADELLGTVERNLSKFVEAADYGRRRLHERSSQESALPREPSDSGAHNQTRQAA